MRDVFKYEKGYWYPHMKPRDVEIWERFIDEYPEMYQDCQYDFHVGDGPKFSTLMDDDTDTNQDALYRLKIDVLAHTPDRVDIIEIKPSAGASTIGQVMGYYKLYTRDENPKKKVGMVIITDKEQPNMAYLCKSEGVKLFVV